LLRLPNSAYNREQLRSGTVPFGATDLVSFPGSTAAVQEAVMTRDLVAFSLLPASRRRSTVLHAFFDLIGSADAPSDDLLERLVIFAEPQQQVPAARARELRARADELVASASAKRLAAITWADAQYPPLLRSISDPPPVLWVRGEPSRL
jgi:hypothetical protein